MSLHQYKENECLLTTQKHCPCVEFILAENERPGFHASQLLHYHLVANEGGNDGTPQGASEKLTIAFATADVTLTGWRLHRLADDLRDGDLLAVRSLPARYANLDTTKCTVASIAVEPVSNG